MELKYILVLGVKFTSIILGLLSILFLNRLDSYNRFIGYYAILVGVFETIAHVIKSILHMNNLQGLHLYTLLEFIILSQFFYLILKKLELKIPIKIIIFLGSFLIIFNSLFLQPLSNFPSNSRLGVEIFIIAMCITVYILLLKNIKEKKIFQASIIFISAIFLKSSLSSVLYLFSNSIMRMEPPLRDQLWGFRGFINLISIIMIFMAFVLILRQSFGEKEPITKFKDA